MVLNNVARLVKNMIASRTQKTYKTAHGQFARLYRSNRVHACFAITSMKVDLKSYVLSLFKKTARSIFTKITHKVHPSVTDTITLKIFSDPNPSLDRDSEKSWHNFSCSKHVSDEFPTFLIFSRTCKFFGIFASDPCLLTPYLSFGFQNRQRIRTRDEILA